MKITFYETYRVLYCEEFFTKEEYDEMWFELGNLCTDEFLINSERAGGARNKNGKMLRFNRGLFIESLMNDSCIIKNMNKIYKKEISEEFVQQNSNFKLLQNKEFSLYCRYGKDENFVVYTPYIPLFETDYKAL
jgi:hypothetical protein